MHLRPCCRGASSQTLAAANLSEQLLFHDIASNARTGIMMHLSQIWSEPQSPRFRQLSGARLTRVDSLHGALVQKPGDLGPAMQRLFQFDLVRVGLPEQR